MPLSCGWLVGLDYEGAIAAVYLHPVLTAVVGDAGHVYGGYGAALQDAADKHVVRGGYRHGAPGVGLKPAVHLCADDRRKLAELTHAHAHRVDDVTEGDGQRVGAVGGVRLPGAVGCPAEHAGAELAEAAGHNFPDVAVGDQVPEREEEWGAPGLEPDHGAEILEAGKLCHLPGLVEGGSERPLGVDVLAGLEGVHREAVVLGDDH